MKRFALPALTVIAAASLAACTTHVPVRGVQPARVSLGATRDLTIVQTNGRRHAVEFVSQEVTRQSRRRGHFNVTDRSHEGTRVGVSGRGVKLSKKMVSGQTMGLRIDVLEYSVLPSVKTVEHKDENGESHIDIVPLLRANTVLAVTLFDADNRAHLAETEYEGVATSERLDFDLEALKRRAAVDAVAHFMNDITPRHTLSKVRLDDDDPGQDAIIKTVKNGDLYIAAGHLRRYLVRYPNNTAAAYNLAVLLDAMGDYEEALEFYDFAVSRSSKGYYSAAREACRRRLVAADALASR